MDNWNELFELIIYLLFLDILYYINLNSIFINDFIY